MAKEFLNIKGLDYNYVDVTDKPSAKTLENVNKVIATGYKSMPMIYFGEEFIGGFQELKGLKYD